MDAACAHMHVGELSAGKMIKECKEKGVCDQPEQRRTNKEKYVQDVDAKLRQAVVVNKANRWDPHLHVHVHGAMIIWIDLAR